MSFTARSISNLKEQVNIVDIVSRAVPLKRAGSNYKGVCPFHSEKTPSFVVSEQKQIFTCFGCGASGDAIEFVKRFYNLDFNEAVEKIAGEYGIELEKRSGYGEDLDIYYKINQEAARFFYRAFTERANKGYAYMKKREIRPEILKKFGIGYADEKWDSLYTYLTGKGFDKKLLVELGLVSENNGRCYDKFRNRVMFPIINTSGKVIGFGGRAIDPNDNPKYLNSPESKVFRKKNNLYGLNLTRSDASKEGFIILVEGYMDTIGLYQGGVTNVAASLGTALTENQARLIKRYTKDVVLSYDADNAGRSAALRGMDILRDEGCRVRVMHVTNGKDPDEYIKKEGRKGFLQLVENALPYADYKIENAKQGYDLTKEEDKIACLKKIAEVLSTLGPVEQDIYIRKVARDIDVSESALRMEIGGQSTPAEAPRRAVRTEEQAPEEELSSVEKDLIRLLTRNESYVEELDWHPEVLTTDIGRRIADTISEDVAEHGSLDINRVEDVLDDRDRAAFVQILETIPAVGDEQKIWDDCLNRSQIEALRAEEQRILNIFSLAEDGGGEEQQELLRRLMQIQEDIEKMKRERMRV